jgi:hypothetical protein
MDDAHPAGALLPGGASPEPVRQQDFRQPEPHCPPSLELTDAVGSVASNQRNEDTMDGLKGNDRVEAEPMPFFTAILVCQLNRCVRPLVAALTAALLVLPPLANAQPAPGHSITAQVGPVIPVALSVQQTGKTYGAWSAAWWEYVEAQPASTGALADATGATCAIGQSAASPVFFLVGTIGSSGKIDRLQCVAPLGKALFFPLANVFDTHVPGDGLDTPAAVWKDMQKAWGTPQSLKATLDGVSVVNFDLSGANLAPQDTPDYACAGPHARCTAPAFTLTLNADNVFGISGGAYYPTVDEGNYLLLAPLAAGKHTLTFGGVGVFLGGTFTQDIAYDLTVQ